MLSSSYAGRPRAQQVQTRTGVWQVVALRPTPRGPRYRLDKLIDDTFRPQVWVRTEAAVKRYLLLAGLFS